MVKVICTIPKRQDIPNEKFHAHWRDPHAGLALRIKAMRRYVQAHRVLHAGLDAPAGPYEGFAEVWFDDVPSALGLGGNLDYQANLVPDEPNFVDIPRLRFVVTEEDVALAGPPLHGGEDTCLKIMQLVQRAPEVSFDEFQATWGTGGRDDELVEELGAFRHVRCRAVADALEDDRPHYDAFRELWWSDAATFDAGRLRAPDAWNELTLSTLIDARSLAVVPVQENRVLWPGDHVAGSSS